MAGAIQILKTCLSQKKTITTEMPSLHCFHQAIINREVQIQAMLRSKFGTLLVVSAALSSAAGFALDARGSIAHLELWVALAILLLLSGVVLIILGQND